VGKGKGGNCQLSVSFEKGLLRLSDEVVAREKKQKCFNSCEDSLHGRKERREKERVRLIAPMCSEKGGRSPFIRNVGRISGWLCYAKERQKRTLDSHGRAAPAVPRREVRLSGEG